MNKNNVSVSAGIIVYRRTPEGVKFLLLYHGGYYWNFPKGKLAEGEKSFKAALREVEEETGLSPKDLRFRDWFRVTDRFVFYTKEKERIPRLVIYYLAETQKQLITIVPREHQGYAWFLYKDAIKMLKAPTLKRNLKRAYETITGNGRKKRQPTQSPPVPVPTPPLPKKDGSKNPA